MLAVSLGPVGFLAAPGFGAAFAAGFAADFLAAGLGLAAAGLAPAVSEDLAAANISATDIFPGFLALAAGSAGAAAGSSVDVGSAPPASAERAAANMSATLILPGAFAGSDFGAAGSGAVAGSGALVGSAAAGSGAAPLSPPSCWRQAARISATDMLSRSAMNSDHYKELSENSLGTGRIAQVRLVKFFTDRSTNLYLTTVYCQPHSTATIRHGPRTTENNERIGRLREMKRRSRGRKLCRRHDLMSREDPDFQPSSKLGHDVAVNPVAARCGSRCRSFNKDRPPPFAR